MSSKILYCIRCLTPNSRPRITFNQQNVCNACLNAEDKKNIDWEDRKKQFDNLVDKIKNFKSPSGYDCIVPWSGGKDSSTIAYKLKFDFGLNPLLVTYAPMIPNHVGQYNRDQLVSLGFDHLYFKANTKVLRHLAKRFFIERGNPKVAWDAGINAIPIQVAVNFNSPFVFYAEHGESVYGGRVLSEEHKRTRDFAEIIENYVGDDPTNWVDEVVSENELNPYIYPNIDKVSQVGVKAYYFGYFFKWSMYENYLFIKDKIDFKLNSEGRTNSTFTNYDSLDDKIDNLYYYMQFIKFGFGRAVRDASRLIQNDHMSREEGLKLAKQYDHEFCNQYFNEVLEYLSINEDDFFGIVNDHRNPDVWEIKGNDFKLKYPLC